MHIREELSALIEDYLHAIRYPSEPDTLYEPISYSLASGGKRIRPLLTMMACDVFSDTVEQALPCAAAIEMFHNFTLLHDDIMDNASVRRGRPAVHRRWGENSAILSGDAMMIYSYHLLERIDTKLLPCVLHIFNDTSLKVCEGQQLDMDFEQLEHVSLDDYLKMISLKTAVLMAGAAEIGALCGGASEEDCRKIYDFGMELGLAFQIRDDILDSYGTPEKLGKNIGGDILEGKKTYLTITAMQKADENTRMRLAGVLHNKEMIAEQKIAEVLDVYARLGVLAVAEKAVSHYTERALTALNSVSVDGEKLEPLRELLHELTDRIK